MSTTTKPKPPRLKEKINKRTMTFSIPPLIKKLLRQAKKDTGLNMSEYVERSLLTQFRLDHILVDSNDRS